MIPRRECFVSVRLTEEERAVVQEAAWRERERLSAWARRILVRTARRSVPQPSTERPE